MNEIQLPDAQQTLQRSASVVSLQSAQSRSQGLEQARRSLNAERLADAEQARDRQNAQIEAAREILQRAVGANTRLEIEAADGPSPFVYRAIDINSGEIVSEWPPVQFASMLRETADALSLATPSGITVDETV